MQYGTTKFYLLYLQDYLLPMSGKINKALLPLSWLYGWGVGMRNKLFDWKLLPVETFDVPVISIGNLAIGGTGKTPHTEYLIHLLRRKYKVAVLSHGYKRKSSGFILADENTDSYSLGDEPYQMWRKFPDLLIAVDADRRRGIRNLLNLPKDRKPEVILLDDAFQHRYVKPSLSILLTDFKQPFYDDDLLPAGRLREPAKNVKRADMVIFTKCPSLVSSETEDERTRKLHAVYGSQKDEYQTFFRYKSLLPVFPENSSVRKASIERLGKESYSVLLIAGLACPEDLIRHIEQYTPGLHAMIYPDHHDFSRKDIFEITDTFNTIQNKNKWIITSEKDAMRLMHNLYINDEMKAFMYYIPIEVAFKQEQEELFTQKIKDHVRNFTRNRIMAEAADT
jgi:tetraacyldisaccharide 4'-kinase